MTYKLSQLLYTLSSWAQLSSVELSCVAINGPLICGWDSYVISLTLFEKFAVVNLTTLQGSADTNATWHMLPVPNGRFGTVACADRAWQWHTWSFDTQSMRRSRDNNVSTQSVCLSTHFVQLRRAISGPVIWISIQFGPTSKQAWKFHDDTLWPINRHFTKKEVINKLKNIVD